MNVNCIICKDTIITEDSVICTTRCGHLFHDNCISTWLKTSRTCPQCRSESCSQRTIHRVYLNISNDGAGSLNDNDNIDDLQRQYQDLQVKLKCVEAKCKSWETNHREVTDRYEALRVLSDSSQKKLKGCQTQIDALKDQVLFYKSQQKLRDNRSAEIVRLKEELKRYAFLQSAVAESRESVNSILLSDQDPESLAMVAALLKKTLSQSEKRLRDAVHSVKSARNEIASLKQQLAQSVEDRAHLEKRMEGFDREKAALKEKLSKLSQNQPGTQIQRVLTESPIPLSATKRRLSDEEETDSPTIDQKVAKIASSNSPYLLVKDAFTMDFSSTFIKKRDGGRRPAATSTSNSLAILRTTSSRLTSADIGRTLNKEGFYYDGLGGHSKEGIFPKPKWSSLVMNKTKCGRVPSAKFKKLAPDAGLKRH